MKKIYFSLITLLLAISSCEEKELSPISESLGKPDPVTEVVVESCAGGALISYKIPNTEDLLSVNCEYEVNGVRHEAVASYFENKLKLEGFNDMEEHTAVLYAVNRSQVKSDPVEVKFTPKESPLSLAAKSVEIKADFGGARFQWRNPALASLTVEFMGPDENGEASTLRIFTSDIDKNSYTIRGFESKESTFSIVLSDNYGNKTEPISATVIPLFEEEVTKSNIKVMRLSDDPSWTNWEGRDEFLIDDNHSNFGSTPNNAVPATVTFDLGSVVKLSRFVLFHRFFSSTYYNHGNPQKMEIYICDHEPDQEGNWADWEKVLDCEVVKPSGSPGSIVTDLDMETARNGFEFNFDLEQKPVRYVRLRVIQAWGSTTFTNFAEIDFYGDVIE